MKPWALAVSLLVVDRQGRIVSANSQAVKPFGYSRQDRKNGQHE